MNPSYSVFFLILFTYYVCGWTSREETKNGTAGTGDCVSRYEEIGVMKLGEQKNINGSCYSVVCNSEGVIIYTGCGSIHMELLEGCQYEEDKSQPYPECCRKVVCNETTTTTAAT